MVQLPKAYNTVGTTSFALRCAFCVHNHRATLELYDALSSIHQVCHQGDEKTGIVMESNLSVSWLCDLHHSNFNGIFARVFFLMTV